MQSETTISSKVTLSDLPASDVMTSDKKSMISDCFVLWRIDDPVKFIQNALSPAKDVEVQIKDEKEREAIAIVNDENSSLAIGKNGQNVKLAARLTKCKIDVKTLVQVQEEGINIYKYYEA